MVGQMLFEMPDDSRVMIRVVQALPTMGFWMDGELRAPREMIDSRKAHADLGYRLDRHHEYSVVVRGDGGRVNADDLASFLTGKLPGFVRFREAGSYLKIAELGLSQALACSFLELGYRGSLAFLKQQPRKGTGYEVCSMKLNGEARSIALSWNVEDEEVGFDVVKPIVAVCESLNLREVKESEK